MESVPDAVEDAEVARRAEPLTWLDYHMANCVLSVELRIFGREVVAPRPHATRNNHSQYGRALRMLLVPDDQRRKRRSLSSGRGGSLRP